ncbi:flavin-containing monooxygenase [Pseudorhodoplanes sp.]|uniref:flavin-containing monooxygenase n=1 Tax=Pseudorhodoplanes sp. TaxID=1934341 RepID=UPI003D0A83CD
MNQIARAVHGPTSPDTIIIGAGLGGLAAAATLKSRGHSNFLILDRGSSVGGVWRDNCYPNASSDTPIELYSFRFFPRSTWSSNFAPWYEILEYTRDLAREFELEKNLALDLEVTSAIWNDASATWNVFASDGRHWTPRFVIWAGGLLSEPTIPPFAGKSSYRGKIVHTAHWTPDIDLTGQAVAVVRGGATSIQILPYAAEHADRVYAFIRTPSYILPKPEVFYTREDWQRFSSSPELAKGLRAKWFDHFEELAATRFPMNEQLIAKQEDAWRNYFDAEVKDPTLRRILRPQYKFGCRRPLVSNTYYAAVTRPNVTAIGTGIEDLFPGGVISQDGQQFNVDSVILATGFNASGMLGTLDFVGRDGQSLADLWRTCPEAYLGTLVKGFPNLFLINGPNAGSASVTDIIESQSRYIASCIELLNDRGRAGLEVREAAHDAYNIDIQNRARQSVLVLGGCTSWYRAGGGTGSVFSHWPGTIASFQDALAKINVDDLNLFDPQGTSSKVVRTPQPMDIQGSSPSIEARVMATSTQQRKSGRQG